MAGTLVRDSSGKRAAYSSSPVAPISEAFDLADWIEDGPGALSITSGELGYTNAGSDNDVTIREVASENVAQDAFIQVVVSQASNGSTPTHGAALRMDAVAAPNNKFVEIRGSSLAGGTFGLVERAAGTTLQTALTTESAWALPTRLSFAALGSDAWGYDFDTLESYALSGLTVDGTFAGWVKHGGSGGASRRISDYYRMTSRYLTVSGLPSGAVVRILDALDAELATAGESGGGASVDLLQVEFPRPRKVQVLDSLGAPIGAIEPSDGVWGGDVYSMLPGVPTGLTVDSATSLTLGLSWDAATLADDYGVERSPDGVSGWVTVYEGTGTGFTDTGLTQDTAYFYRVRACNDSGCSDWSAAVEGRTLAFLRIAGITVPVSPSGASVLPPERLGSSARMFGGELRTTVRVEKRGWRFRVPSRPLADWAALEAAIATGNFVSCIGAALGGTYTCEVSVSDAELVPVPGGFRKSFTLTLREV